MDGNSKYFRNLSPTHLRLRRRGPGTGRVAAIAILLIFVMSGQSDDVFRRVDAALGAAAAAELKNKDFNRLSQRLKDATAETDERRAELWALRGVVAFLQGKMEEAAPDFLASEAIRPLREPDRFTLAMALVNLGDDGRARTVLATLAANYPGQALYWYWLGKIDYDQRRYSEAVTNLQQATTLDAASARAWDALGLAWDMQGRLDSAKPAFEKAASLNRAQAQPSPWPPHNLGSLLLRTGELPDAERALRESLQYDAKLAKTHLFLGRLLEKQGKAAEAMAEYQRAADLDTGASDACYSLALLYRKLHRSAEAEATFAEFDRRKRREKTTP